MRTPTRYEAKDGTVTWRVRFRTEGRQRSETFEDEAAALDFCKLMDTLGPQAALTYIDCQDDTPDQTPTLDEWAGRHIKALTGITEGTRMEYQRMHDREWAPRLGSLPLDAINREAVAHAINDMSTKRADKTVRNYHGLLSAILNSAVAAGHIRTNPAVGLRLPRRTSHEVQQMRLLSQTDFARLLEHIDSHYQPLVTLLAATGMRWGEAMALTPADVDVDNRAVRITKAAKWDSTKSVKDIGPTKTTRSNRTVTLPDQALTALGPLLADRPRRERLFVTKTGQPIRHSRFWMDIWQSACEASGLDPRPRIHDLRHSHASWLIAAGVPLPVIQRRLGHSTITTTVDTYGHLAPDLQRAAADAAQNVLGGVGEIEG